MGEDDRRAVLVRDVGTQEDALGRTGLGVALMVPLDPTRLLADDESYDVRSSQTMSLVHVNLDVPEDVTMTLETDQGILVDVRDGGGLNGRLDFGSWDAGVGLPIETASLTGTNNAGIARQVRVYLVGFPREVV